MQKNKCVFLDRDGTIIYDGEYVADVSKLKLIPDAVKSLKKLQDNGYLLIVVTNQSGVARGYFSESDVVNFNNVMINEFKKFGVNITEVFYCPHHENGVNLKYAIKCNCRKPNKGLFLNAANKYNIDLSKSYAIGDKIRDLCICDNSGCKGFLLIDDGFKYENVTLVSSLTECVDIILRG